MTLNRRAFVAATGAALAGWQRSLRAADRVDVVVIGAGLAGLHAASILAEQGADVVLLEASDRVGGRVHTADQLPGRPELGASQIGAHYGRVRDVVRKLNVPIAPWAPTDVPFAYSVRGVLVRKEDWERSPANLTVGAERAVPPSALLESFIARHNPLPATDAWLSAAAGRYDVSAKQWLGERGTSAEALRLINEGLIAADVNDISMLTILQESTRLALDLQAVRSMKPGTDPTSITARVVGGSSRLPEAMVRALGDRIRLRQPVAAIRLDGSGVEVACRGGERYRADQAIAAVPFSVLRRVAIEPALTGAQGEAIARMPYGNTTQVFLEAKGAPYWEQDGLDGSLWTDGAVNVLRRGRSQDGADYLIAVATGRKADRLDRLSATERGKFVLAELARLRPSTRGKLEVIGMHSWAQETFVGGCRHSYRPGEVREFSGPMIKPHGRLHFAGEHTRRLEIGMESAMESGERVALEILAG